MLDRFDIELGLQTVQSRMQAIALRANDDQFGIDSIVLHSPLVHPVVRFIHDALVDCLLDPVINWERLGPEEPCDEKPKNDQPYDRPYELRLCDHR